MKRLDCKILLALLPFAAGCLSPAPRAPVYWAIGPIDAAGAKVARAGEPKPGTARLGRVEVRAPYDGQRLAVLRADGSLAFDPGNSFAASPAALLPGAAADIMAASAFAEQIVAQHSSAFADSTVEVTVTRLALDCREQGSRKALVSLTATLVDAHRRAVAAAAAEAAEDASAGDYSAAFSAAFTAAMTDALRRL